MRCPNPHPNIIQTQEKSLGVTHLPLLSEHWSSSRHWCHTLVVSTLLRPEYVYDMNWSFLSRLAFGRRPSADEQWEKFDGLMADKLKTFIDDEKRTLLATKEEEQKEYLVAEEEYFGTKPCPSSEV